MVSKKGGVFMEQNNLWEQVGNRCLELARQELNKETAPAAATVETVERLVGIAISIDDLNLRWEVQGNPEKVISVSGPGGKTPEDRERLARSIEEILRTQSQAHSSRQPPGPTSPEQSQGAEFQLEQSDP